METGDGFIALASPTLNYFSILIDMINHNVIKKCLYALETKSAGGFIKST